VLLAGSVHDVLRPTTVAQLSTAAYAMLAHEAEHLLYLCKLPFTDIQSMEAASQYRQVDISPAPPAAHCSLT
jgi:hypothetical protein